MAKKLVFFSILAITLGLFLCRLFLYKNVIDPASCVYHTESLWRWFAVLLAAFIPLLAALLYFTKKEQEHENAYPDGCQMTSALGLICCFVGTLLTCGEMIFSKAIFPESEVTFFGILYILVVLLALFGFAFSATVLLIPQKSVCNFLAALAPMPLLLTRLFQYYISGITARNVVEFPWEMVMLGAECLFFLFFSRRMAGYLDRRTLWLDSIFSALCLGLVVGSSAVRFFLLATVPDLINRLNEPAFLDLAVGVAAFFELISLSFANKKKETEDSLNNSEEEVILMSDFHFVDKSDDAPLLF